MQIPDKCLVIAGESSGDKYGKNLILEIQNIFKDIEVFAIGGTHIESTGANLIENIDKLTVVGLTEVIKHLPVVKKTLDKIKSLLKNQKIDFVILIDYPDFNFRVAKYAYNLGIPVFYFVSPQVWAWRKGRVKFLKKYVKELFVIFPFEVHFYKGFNINVKFVGHPLVENIKNFLSSKEKRKTEVEKKDFIITLLPGSRTSEVKKLLPLFIESAKLIKNKYNYIKFNLIVAPSLDFQSMKSTVEKEVDFINVFKYGDYELMNNTDLFISASGTATFENALFGKPVVIVYKVNLISYIIGRMLINVKYIGMPNILLGEGANPELIQNRATPVNIFMEARKFIENKEKYKKVSELNKSLLDKLYKKDVFKIPAVEIAKYFSLKNQQ
jgi:lipid-A-disaccharide synthase